MQPISHSRRFFLKLRTEIAQMESSRNNSEASDGPRRLLREREQLKASLALGRKQLDEGDYEEFDCESLHSYFDTLKQRAQAKADASES
jgi:hypothetical protein